VVSPRAPNLHDPEAAGCRGPKHKEEKTMKNVLQGSWFRTSGSLCQYKHNFPSFLIYIRIEDLNAGVAFELGPILLLHPGDFVFCCHRTGDVETVQWTQV
jgi:hypothetical protein